MKVNLEQELKKVTPILNTPREILLIQEYEKVSDTDHSASILHKIGMLKNVEQGMYFSLKKNREQKELSSKGYDQTKVYHISQIKEICERYYLKFLPAKMYRGDIDRELPYKIGNFVAAYQIDVNDSNTFICAPPESFELQENPKDPLFFVQVSESYFYLVHKWGNDMSFTRRFFVSVRKQSTLQMIFFLLGSIPTTWVYGHIYLNNHMTWPQIIFCALTFVVVELVVLFFAGAFGAGLSLSTIKFRSPFKD